jgi:hypothetical protein
MAYLMMKARELDTRLKSNASWWFIENVETPGEVRVTFVTFSYCKECKEAKESSKA